MQKPTQDKSDNQYKKYQQRTRQGDTPEKESHIHGGDILSDKDHGKASYDQNQY
jgi:hypothetical protein